MADKAPKKDPKRDTNVRRIKEDREDQKRTK